MYCRYQKVYTAATGTETYLSIEAILKWHNITSFFCTKGQPVASAKATCIAQP